MTEQGPSDGQGLERDIVALPFHQSLGFIFDGREAGVAKAHFKASDNLIAFGALHAGVLYSLLDVICMLALLPSLRIGQHAATHNVHVSLMRAVRPGDTCRLRGRVLRLGRSLAFAEGRAEVDGQLVAVAQVTKSLA